MFRRLLLTACLAAITPAAFSQTEKPDPKRAAADHFVQTMNAGNYRKMHHGFGFITGAIISKGRLKKMFSPLTERYGKARIDSVVMKSSTVIMWLAFDKDPDFSQRIGIVLSKRNKVIGFSAKADFYSFPPRPTAEPLDVAMARILKESFPNGFNGSVLYAQHDTVVYAKNFGMADIAANKPLNDSSLFELASVSKQFTAAAIMKLQEQGKLSVTDSLQNFFPQLPYKNITVEQLLHHQSGLADYMGPLMKKSVKKEFCTNDDILAWLAHDKPKLLFTPGDRFDYSNTGYAVLASIVEKASGMSYGDYLQTYFFKPLGMTHTRVYTTRRVKKEVIPNYAYGYVYDDKKKAYVLPDSTADAGPVVIKLDGIYGDGTVNSTAHDLMLWSRGLNAHTVLSAASLEKAYTPGKLNSGKATDYGYGVEVHAKTQAGLLITHTGGWPGYQTMIHRFVDQDKVLVILCNEETENANILLAGKKMMSLLLTR